MLANFRFIYVCKWWWLKIFFFVCILFCGETENMANSIEYWTIQAKHIPNWLVVLLMMPAFGLRSLQSLVRIDLPLRCQMILPESSDSLDDSPLVPSPMSGRCYPPLRWTKPIHQWSFDAIGRMRPADVSTPCLHVSPSMGRMRAAFASSICDLWTFWKTDA